MKIFLGIVFALILLFTILCFIPLRFFAEYERDEGKNESKLSIKYGTLKFNLGGKKPKKPKKENEKKEKKPISFEEKKEKIKLYTEIFEKIKGDVKNALSYLVRRGIEFDEVELKSDFGFSDAMHTGIFTGIYNGFVYGILAVVHHNCTLKKMDIVLTPIFNKTCFNIKARCILRIKIVHIIVVGFKVLKILIKIKKKKGSR